MISRCTHARYSSKLYVTHVGACRRWGPAAPTARTPSRRFALTRHRPSSKNGEITKNGGAANPDAQAAWEKQLALKRDLALAVGEEDYRLAASLKKEITALDASLPGGVLELILSIERLNAATKSQDKLEALDKIWEVVDDYEMPDFLEERCMQAMQSVFPAADSPVEGNIQREFLGLMLEDDALLRDDGVLEELVEFMAVIKLEAAKVMYDVVRLKQQRMRRSMELERLRLLAAQQHIAEMQTAWTHFKQHRLPFVSLGLVAVLTMVEWGAICFLPLQPYTALAVFITLCLSSQWFLNVLVVALFKALYGKDLQVVLGWVPKRKSDEGAEEVVQHKIAEPES